MRKEPIDFSPLHDTFIVSDDGTVQRADEVYFKAKLRVPGVWQVTTDGDYIYVVEGENEALVVDTGYGCGNVRELCQTLTDKPIYRAVNTHEHFDHTAGNSYFDKVYMTEACKEAVLDTSRNFAEFEGIDFPLDYEIEVVSDGFIFDLGGRKLEVFCVPDHAAGSLMLLDRENKLLFSGDELGTPAYKEIKTSVAQYAKNINRIYENFEDIDWIFGGGFVYDRMILYRQLKCLEKILKGYPGQNYLTPDYILPEPDPEGRYVIPRRVPNPYKFAKMAKVKQATDFYRRIMTYGYCSIIYDSRHIYE